MPDEPGTPREVAGEVVSQPVLTGDWLTPPAAADRLGVSERTLWRDVKNGKYHKRIVNRRAEILVPTSASVPVTGDKGENPGNTLVVPDRTSASETDTALAMALVEEIKAQRDQDRATIVSQAEEIGRLRAELARSRRVWFWEPWLKRDRQ